MKTLIITVLGGGLLVTPALAQAPSGIQGALQGLLSGNQNQDQAVRDAYERGYQRGREDEARLANNRGNGGGRASGSGDRSLNGATEPSYSGNGRDPNGDAYPANGYGQNR